MPAHSTEKITLLLADDHPMTRAGIRATLAQASDLEIVGEAQNGIEVQQMVAELRPRILLLEIEIPGLHPVKFLKWLKDHYSETITLVFTSHDHGAHLAVMMDAGVAGYLCKNEFEPKLVGSVRRVAKGEILFDATQLTRAKQWREEVGEKIKKLTHREYEILILLAKGMDNKVIAKALAISVKTTAYHITNILSKLQVPSRQEAAVWALQHLSDDLE